jgi:hypothetical protein
VQSGFWLAASFMTRHEMMLALLPITAWLWLDGRQDARERWRRLAAFAPGIGIGAVVWLAFNAARFGNPLDSGYLRDAAPGLGSPILAGLAALLLSPAASLFLYSPVAAAAVPALIRMRTRQRSLAALVASLVAVFVVFYASLGNWLGGRSYGSRYLVVVLPLLAVACAAAWPTWSARARTVALGLVLAGFVVQMPGVLVDYAKVSQSVAMREPAVSLETRQWVWARSPLILNTHALVQALPENIAYLTGQRPMPIVTRTGDAADREFSQQFSFSLDLWWLYLFYLGAFSRLDIALVLTPALFAVLWLIRSSWRLRASG